MEQRFLGTGMKFPPQIDPATGRFRLSSGSQSVKESVYLILMTQVTERLTRPDFGTESSSYVFMDTSLTQLTIMKRELTESILRQEPRIEAVNIEIETENQQGYVLVSIDYVLAENSQRDNLVFPFYLNEMPEVENEPDYYEPDMMDLEQ